MSIPFRTFVAEEAEHGHILQVDHLLLLHYLLRHPSIESPTAARLTQLAEDRTREVCDGMVGRYLEKSGEGQEAVYRLRLDLHERLSLSVLPERARRGTWEAAKAQVLRALQQRAHRGEHGLANTDIRQLTHLDRNQVVRLMRELREEHPQIYPAGKGRGARYEYRT